MKKEPLMSRVGFAKVSALGLGLMLAPASPAFAGISSFSITSATLAPSKVLVTVNGTVACPSSEVFSILVGVTQFVRGKFIAHAFGEIPNPQGMPPPISCTGAVLNWTVVASSGIPMKAGPASVVANALAFDPTTFAEETALTSAEFILKSK